MPAPGVLAASGRVLGSLEPVDAVVSITSGVNLIPTALTWQPAAPVAGDQVSFLVTVQNIGDTPTPAGRILDFTIRVAGSTITWEDVYTASLAPGASVQLKTGPTWTFPPPFPAWTAQPGSFPVDATVNGQGRIDEGANTGDNIISRTIVVTDPGGGGDPGSPGDIAAATAASKIVLWTAIGEFSWNNSQIDDATLDDFHNNRHLGGAVLIIASLRNDGGDKNFTGAPSPTFDGSDGRTSSEWDYHKTLAQHTVGGRTLVQRFHDRGMKLYLGTRLPSINSAVVQDQEIMPRDPWNDAKWAVWLASGVDSGGIIPFMLAAKHLGFDGIAIDPEATQFGDGSGGQMDYRWTTFRNAGHDRASTFAKIKQRGTQWGNAAVAAGAGGLELVIYFPTGQGLRHGWDEDYNQVAAGNSSSNGTGVPGNGECLYDGMADSFWDGFTSVPNAVSRFIVFNSVFYKPGNLSGPSGRQWKAMVRYDVLHIMARLSQEWSNPDVQLPAMQLTPFTWLDNGLNTGEGITDPASADQEATDNNKTGMGGMWGLYEQQWETADYTQWATALGHGASTTAPNNVLPDWQSNPVAGGAGTTKALSGTARHTGYGIVYVEWLLTENDGTTEVTHGKCRHVHNIGSKVYNVDDGYTDSTYPFTATVPSAIAGRKLFVIEHSPQGQKHSAEIDF